MNACHRVWRVESAPGSSTRRSHAVPPAAAVQANMTNPSLAGALCRAIRRSCRPGSGRMRVSGQDTCRQQYQSQLVRCAGKRYLNHPRCGEGGVGYCRLGYDRRGGRPPRRDDSRARGCHFRCRALRCFLQRFLRQEGRAMNRQACSRILVRGRWRHTLPNPPWCALKAIVRLPV